MLEIEMTDSSTARSYRSPGLSTAGAVDELATTLGRQMAVYTIKYQAAAAARLGIPLGDVKALDLVMAFDALATGHLAQLLGVSAGGATALINRLESAGLVVRDRNPLDRRVIVIRAVQEKCDVLIQERQHLARQINEQTRRLGTADLEVAHGFVMDLARTMRRETLTWLDTHAALMMDD